MRPWVKSCEAPAHRTRCCCEGRPTPKNDPHGDNILVCLCQDNRRVNRQDELPAPVFLFPATRSWLLGSGVFSYTDVVFLLGKIDHRLVGQTIKFFNGQFFFKTFDLFSWALRSRNSCAWSSSSWTGIFFFFHKICYWRDVGWAIFGINTMESIKGIPWREENSCKVKPLVTYWCNNSIFSDSL